MTNRFRKKRRLLITLLCVFLALPFIVIGYLAYVFIAYNRLSDNLSLDVRGNVSDSVRTGTKYTVLSFNIGFGAYEPDFSFFMDGGTQSWAWSKDKLLKNMAAILSFLTACQADFCLLQEVDEKATRTYKVNERAMLEESFAANGRDTVFAQNWDSPFLFYPLTQPHGKSVSGILTASRFSITSALRRSLPIEDSLIKIADLDRCYSIASVPAENGRELVLYNVHLSAYTSDGSIATEQLRLLLDDMTAEYEKGNYIICGGDFNKDLLGDSSRYFGVPGQEYTWAHPVPAELFNDLPLTLVSGTNAPSCRIADAPYNPQQFVLTVDGFIVSDNVQVLDVSVIDTGFTYSDHNPTQLTFTLLQ